jgi:hypothetical protein|eukprot:COSAG06_NODE_499_length_14998_cov_20.019934_7_plen_46_part_00
MVLLCFFISLHPTHTHTRFTAARVCLLGAAALRRVLDRQSEAFVP